MEKKKFNKKVVNAFRYIYKVGILKTIAIGMAILASGAEVEIKWKNRHVQFRKGTTDFMVFKQVMVFGQYDVKALNSLKGVNTIVDLGANIGLSALHFKMKYPDATIIAVEPEKKNFDILEKNVSGLSNVYCLNNAIWNSHKNLGIYDIGLGEYGFVVNEENDKEIGAVTSLTINEIMGKFQVDKIDILKIDIEGSEKELFEKNYETWLPKVRSIVIELHDWFRPGCAASFFRAISPYEYNMSFKGENVTIVFTDKSNTTTYGKIIPEHDAEGDNYVA